MPACATSLKRTVAAMGSVLVGGHVCVDLAPALTADGGEPLVALFTRARAAGITTSLDLAVVDPASPAARLDWWALLRRVLPLVDVLSPSVEDVRTTFRGPAPGADELVDMGVAVVMLTSGPDGLRLATGSAGRLDRAGAVLAGRAAAWAGQQHFVVPPRVPVR